MDKRTIIRSLKSYVDGAGMMNITQIAGYMGWHPDNATLRDLLSDLDYIPRGREKCFSAEDVAERILEKRRRSD